MRRTHRTLLSAPALVVLLAACGSMGNTLAQDLAWERWEKCKVSGLNLSRITPEGQIWVTYQADHVAALREWQECDRKARAERGQHRVSAEPAVAMAIGQQAAGRAAVDASTAPVWKVGHEWAYRYETPSGTGTFVWRVDRTETLGDQPHWVIRTGTREIFYRTSDLAFTRETVGGQVVRLLTPSDWRFVAFPLVVGRSWDMNYEEARPLDRQTENIVRSCLVEAEESLTVPAGIFQSLRIRCVNKRNGAWVSTFWYSPQVGHLVREESSVPGGRRVRELIAYKLR